MSTTHAEPAPAPVTRVPPQVQRCGGTTCPPGTCDHDEEVRRLADGPGPDAVPPTVLGVLGTPGTPLDPATRTRMEGRFGHDFGRVRIHTDAEAARSATDIQALAYTYGSHVVMGAGRYQPHTPAGQRLLAHELTHVVQQGSQAGAPTSVSDPHDPAEQAAAHTGDTTTDSDPAGAGRTSATPGRIGRQAAATPAGGTAVIRVDCAAMIVEFITDVGSESYEVTSCGLRPGTYTAVAQADGEAVDLDFGQQMSDESTTFSYRVGEQQRGPTSLFRSNNAPVTVIVSGAPATVGPENVVDDEPYDPLFEETFSQGPSSPENASSPVLPGVEPGLFFTPGASYALALTPGFSPGGGYAPPPGLLADSALAQNTARGLLSSQGLATAETTVVEGAELAETLSAAGEGILVFEAAGGGEAEVAVPVAGWIVGAVVLAAAGGLILAGYLLKRRRQEAAATGAGTAAQSKTGNCTEERHDTLQSEVDRQCKDLPRACTPGMTKAELKRNAFRNWRCARVRDLMNKECFDGGDEGHKRAAQLAWQAYDNCWDLYQRADRGR